MKNGDVIGGYRVITKPNVGGWCTWAFAERGGVRYFIKEFKDPKWPSPTSAGNEASKAARRAECEEFERRQRRVTELLNPTAVGGGNLVTAVDFGRFGTTTYYKITEAIQAESAGDLTRYTPRQRAVVMRTLCQSIKLLHRARIVHGDLKPENIMLQKASEGDLYTAKLIDFDDAYETGDPPPSDEIRGDQLYVAPEWLRYVKQDPAVKPADLTTKTDIFSLGLIFHVYICGALPEIGGYGLPAEAVWAGTAPRLSPRLHPAMAALLGLMLTEKPGDRPRVEDVISRLSDESVFELAEPARTAHPLPAGPSALPGRPSRIRVNRDIRTDPEPAPIPSRPAAARGVSRVKKNFD